MACARGSRGTRRAWWWMVVVAWAAAAAGARAEDGAGDRAWIERSNAHAKVLLDTNAAFFPEDASRIGVTVADEKVADLEPERDRRYVAALDAAIGQLEPLLAAEPDPRVRQDLEILLEAARRARRQTEVSHRLQMPFVPAAAIVFGGEQVLLDDQAAPERHASALPRLRRYLGLEPGSVSIFQRAAERFRERAGESGLLAPVRGEVEKEIGDIPAYVEGVKELFAKWKIESAGEALAALATQAEAHREFLRAEVLPRAREDFRLPPELYALSLEAVGVDLPVEEVERRARAAFAELQTQMQSLAPRVAREKGIRATDYRDVIRALKKKQLGEKAIVAHYTKRIRDLEEIIRRERIVTLPARPMLIELASAAESAAVPAPHLRGPRLLGNTGERAVFSLPLRAASQGGEALAFDDFTFEAASWTLGAHEGRPGHELQFARNLEQGVSIARVLFAFNSVNVEGWALYAEAEAQPYEPPDGQLIALQHRLMRAARAMLDPALQGGKVTKEEAYRVLREDVVLSEPMAKQEVDRYTFLAPAQAVSYFVGYSRLLEIRTSAQLALGAGFDRMRFNDFVLSQGLVPPRLLAKAVAEELVPRERAAAKAAP